MRREEKSRDVKNAIINVSRELFTIQGYKVTTIRQITKKAGITIGSLYHFFRGKEDIFLNIVYDVFSQFLHVSDSIIGKDNNTPLKYAFIYALELKVIEKSDIVAEVYLEAYSSWRITEYMLPFFIQRNRAFFHKYNKNFTDRDYCMRILAIRGVRMSFINERLKQGKLDFTVKCPFIIETSLSLYNVPSDIIKASITQAMQLVKEKRIEVYGVKI